MTSKEYRIEVAQLLLSGEWLPLQYLAALLGRRQDTVKLWVSRGEIEVKKYGYKHTNLYNVEQAIIAHENAAEKYKVIK